jgi:hypothetical protein
MAWRNCCVSGRGGLNGAELFFFGESKTEITKMQRIIQILKFIKKKKLKIKKETKTQKIFCCLHQMKCSLWHKSGLTKQTTARKLKRKTSHCVK